MLEVLAAILDRFVAVMTFVCVESESPIGSLFSHGRCLSSRMRVGGYGVIYYGCGSCDWFLDARFLRSGCYFSSNVQFGDVQTSSFETIYVFARAVFQGRTW